MINNLNSTQNKNHKQIQPNNIYTYLLIFIFKYRKKKENNLCYINVISCTFYHLHVGFFMNSCAFCTYLSDFESQSLCVSNTLADGRRSASNCNVS